MAKETWTVNTKTVSSNLRVRNGPGTANKTVGCILPGQMVTSSERKGSWAHLSNGWACISDGGKVYLVLQNNDTKDVPPKPPIPAGAKAPALSDEETTGYKPASCFYQFTSGNYDQSEVTTIRNIMAIFGLPYQFLPNADCRLYDKNASEVKKGATEDGAALGRVYSSKIVSKMPVLLISPGKPSFMTRFGNKDKKNIIESMIGTVSGSAESTSLQKLLTIDGRYYTFQIDHVRYFHFVNPMCRIAAQYLGVGNYKLDGVALKNVNWGDGSVTNPKSFIRSRLEAFMNTGLPGYIAFYINSDTQISESFSNSTTESMLASKTDSISDMGRELNFLLGYGSSALGANIDAFQNTDIASDVENVEDFVTGILGKNNFIKSLTNHLTTVAKGGKLTFPEIWSDSSFSRSFDVNIKLTTPDCDKLSWYFNICVPMLHLIALVAPQSINANPNGYTSPFLIRAVYKGLFNVDMGIITSMSITKGQEGAWTRDGLPTVVDINFSIKDLYEAMSITSMQGSAKYDTMNNTALMDYIANMCGINIFKPEIMRNIDMWFVQNIENKARDTLYNSFAHIEQSVLNKIMEVYDRNRYI